MVRMVVGEMAGHSCQMRGEERSGSCWPCMMVRWQRVVQVVVAQAAQTRRGSCHSFRVMVEYGGREAGHVRHHAAAAGTAVPGN